MDQCEYTELLHSLLETPSLEQFLAEHENEFRTEGMAELLLAVLKEKGLSKAALARRSYTSEVYLHQVISGRRSPSRDRLLCLCLGLECELAQVQEMLRRCGYSTLYVRDKRDAILLYCGMHHKTVLETNDLLDRFGELALIR